VAALAVGFAVYFIQRFPSGTGWAFLPFALLAAFLIALSFHLQSRFLSRPVFPETLGLPKGTRVQVKSTGFRSRVEPDGTVVVESDAPMLVINGEAPLRQPMKGGFLDVYENEAYPFIQHRNPPPVRTWQGA